MRNKTEFPGRPKPTRTRKKNGVFGTLKGSISDARGVILDDVGPSRPPLPGSIVSLLRLPRSRFP